MINLILIIIIGLIKSICCTLYIDLRYNYASDGVYVHHGHFMNLGNYKMYLGEEKPLEKVYFGDQKMHPPKTVLPNNYQLIVEVFDTSVRKYCIIHSYFFKKGIQESIIKLYYELGQTTYIELDLETFLNELNYEPVLLSMDIGPKHRHPFILRTVIETSIEKKVTFTILDEFNGTKLDGIHGPKYTFGKIYDSTKPIVVGYTKLPFFIRICNEVTIEYKFQPEKVVIKVGKYIYYFELKTIIGNQIWYLTNRPGLIHLEIPTKKAVLSKDKIDSCNQNIFIITVDISEQLTPELYGIEKTIGTLGEYGYVMYEVKTKYRKEYIIKSVVDMKTEYMHIYTMSKNCDFATVEVLRNNDKTIVIITSQIKIGLTCIKHIDIFEKDKNNHNYYNKIDEKDKQNILESFQKLYPIRINVILNDEPKAIYDKNEISGPGMNFLHYSIKDFDEKGNDLRSKYTFGVIWEIDPYENGNIPYDGWKTEYRLIKNAIHTRKFMIRNNILGIPVDTRSYEIYTILS